MKFLAALAAIAAVASALQITEPKLDAKLDFSKSNTIKWTAVDSDPKEFKIELVDHSDSAGQTSVTLVEKVASKDEEYKFENFVAKAGDKYSFKFISIDKQNTGQLAESQIFEVTKSGVKSTTTSPPTGGPTDKADSTTTSTSTGGAVAGAVGVAGPIAAAILAFLA